MKQLNLKEIHNNSSNSGANGAILSANDRTNDFLAKAIIQSSTYSDLFKDGEQKPKLRTRRLAIVKIHSPKHNSTIWRECDTKGVDGIDTNSIGLPFKAIWELGISGSELKAGVQLNVSKGCRLMFYLKHPDHAARIATRMGLISICLAIISIALTLFI